MSNTSELKDTGILALFKGPPKEGKSIAAHCFPNSYTFDFDDKIRVVANYFPNQSFDYDTFSDIIDVRMKVEELKSHCSYDTLIVDTITEAANLAMRSLVAYRDPNWKIKCTRANNKDKTVRAGIPMTEIEDYAGESKFLGDLVDDLKIVRIKYPRVNIIFIGHTLIVKYKDTKGDERVSQKELVTWGNKIGASLPGKFEEVLHFGRETSLGEDRPRFICYGMDHNGNGAGSSIGLPNKLDWTDKDFYKLLMKYKNKEIL